MDSIIARFHNFLEGNALIIEVSLLLLSFLTILLYYFDIPNSNLFLVRSVNFAAFVYFFFAIFERKDHKIADVVGAKIIAIVGPRIIAIGFTTALLGAWFKLMNYPGQELMLKIGVVLMSLSVVLIWGYYRRNWSSNLVASVIRISLIATLGLILWFL